MTDKETIRALECCIRPGFNECEKCPLRDEELCMIELKKESLHLITAQKSQIDDLYSALDERIQRIKELEAEIDRLQNHNLIMARKHFDDGIRELAERLKEEKFPWKNAHSIQQSG